jgi:hypothetical protein
MRQMLATHCVSSSLALVVVSYNVEDASYEELGWRVISCLLCLLSCYTMGPLRATYVLSHDLPSSPCLLPYAGEKKRR